MNDCLRGYFCGGLNFASADLTKISTSIYVYLRSSENTCIRKITKLKPSQISAPSPKSQNLYAKIMA